ncbi:MAG: hypothetical protein M1825_006119 [Sarcosagium campestre]|nr:MAG: hypothetical protein M1825_006119 [Sarcosagium campestre]
MVSLKNLALVAGSLCMAVFSDAYAITGPSGGVNPTSGARATRREIRDFQTTGAAWDLYLQALQQFELKNQNDQFSFYQVAGIHGRPFVNWDGSSGPYNTGYCTHSSIIFPPWHRPYLALYEQLLYNNAKAIAAKYPSSSRARYVEAARTFRIPYWDWAKNAKMPNNVNVRTISVNTPTGRKTIDNPLYSYKFHVRNPNSQFPSSDGDIARYQQTVRYPDANGNSRPNAVNDQLLANQANLHDRTYLLLTRQPSYAPFSNTGYTDNRGQTYDSLEAIHNDIHGLTGNGGHMSYVPYSAFDPIFWLHHTNVDRIFALWQAIYPNSYVGSQTNPFGTRTNAPGGVENVNTRLTPFRKDAAGNYWTSASARSLKTFKYTYPEIVDWNVSPSQLSANVRAKVRALYDPQGRLSRREVGALSGLTHKEAGALAERDFPSLAPKYTIPQDLKNGSSYLEWFVNFQVDKNELNEPNFVHFFLGKVSENPLEWSASPNLVGSHASFTVQNTTIAPQAIVLGQMPLTRKLVAAADSGLLKSLEPCDVKPFLTKYLSWRVQTFDDRAVPTENLPSLKVYVVDQKVIPSKSFDSFPLYGKLTPHTDVTKGKVGGTSGGAVPNPLAPSAPSVNIPAAIKQVKPKVDPKVTPKVVSKVVNKLTHKVVK